MGLFDPHPDHPMIEPQDLFVASSGMGNYEKFFMKHVNTGSWLIKAGDAVAAGQPLLPLRFGKEPFGYIHSPLAGKIKGIARKPAEGGDLFAVQYFEGGGGAIDPFADVARVGIYPVDNHRSVRAWHGGDDDRGSRDSRVRMENLRQVPEHEGAAYGPD
jgi:hypothetical protein